MSSETHHIPLEIAHKFLATFGITKPTEAYERWLKNDGFELKDFDDVLFESELIYTVDWRACLVDELETICDSLAKLNVTLVFEMHEDGDAGIVKCEEKEADVSYRPNDGSDFDNVILGIQSVIPANIEFRAERHNGGGDTLIYAALPKDEWDDLENTDSTVLKHFFAPLVKNA